VRDHLDDPAAFAAAFDARTEEAVAPFYRNQIREDRFRAAEMNALRNGLEPAAMTPRSAQILAAAGQDGDVLRGVLETVQCLALPEEVFQRPGIRERIEATDPVSPPPAPGPDRAQLLQLLGS
nr:FAD-dependent oxidoreductase [Geodermatophilaceae bacterium]